MRHILLVILILFTIFSVTLSIYLPFSLLISEVEVIIHDPGQIKEIR